jgi:hypothetical protein
MVTQYAIESGLWTPITGLGEVGTCWLDEDDDGAGGSAVIKVFHGRTAPTDADLTESKRVYKPAGNNDVMAIKADAFDDVFYARAVGAGSTAIISVDVTGKVPQDVALQDQVSPIVDVFVTQKLGTATLAEPTVIDSRTVTMEAGHNFVAGNMIEIDNGDMRFFQSRVRLVAGNVLTLTNLVCFTFPVTSTVRRVSMDLGINAAAAPVIFTARPPAGVRWDINILSINMLDDVAMDDGKFGGITALTNGVIFRTVNHDQRNIFTAIDNGCFRRHCDTEQPYSDKAPAGIYGLNVKRHFNGQNGDGVAKRIGGSEISEFQVVVNDDLSALSRFWVVLRGHVVED